MGDDETLFDNESDWLGGNDERQDDSQPMLFEEGKPWWSALWRGMPEFAQRNLGPWQSVPIHFRNRQDRDTFALLVNQKLYDNSRGIWFPTAEVVSMIDKQFKTSIPVNPRYPIYVPTKGRWDTAFTIKSLELLGVPYYAVVQPQEAEYYKAVVKTGVILQLPDGMDGLVPARNWIKDHSINTLGAARHWQIDDNIGGRPQGGFYRLYQNLKVPIATGACFRAMEDFSDRYENVVISGPNYFMFASRKTNLPPLTLNTRVYSCSLINNVFPYRWRGIYNDDTDLCLRVLKDGYCIVLFNAFLCMKQTTMTVAGGNTPIYQGDGRLRMAQELRNNHSDVVTITEKWGHAQHQVDYRRFRENKLIPRAGVVIQEGVDDYGMVLERLSAEPSLAVPIRQPRQPEPASPSMSAFDFVLQQAKPDAQLEVKAEPTETPLEPVLDEPDAPSVTSERVFADALTARGHRLLTRDGRLFVTDASRLTEDDRAYIKAHRSELLARAKPWPNVLVVAGHEQQPEGLHKEQRLLLTTPEGSIPSPAPTSLFDSTPQQTLAQFLGTAPPRIEHDWCPDEPPDLTGIKNIVLNFATDGLDWAHGHQPIGVTVSTLDGQLTRFLPFRFAGGNLDETVVRRWAQEQIKGKHILNANTRFDLHMARCWGIDLEAQGCTFSDIQHTAALLDDHRRKFALDVLATDYLPGNVEVPRLDESRHAEHHAAEVAPRELYTARLVGRLREVMYPLIEKDDLRRVHDLEDAVIPVVAEMEKNAAPIDVPLLKQWCAETAQMVDDGLREIAKEVGFAVNPDSNDDMQRLFQHFNIPFGGETEGGKPSFTDKILKSIDNRSIQLARKIGKLASLRAKFLTAYDEAVGADGLLRFNLHQLRGDEYGTVRGRFSASDKNIQQVMNADTHLTSFGSMDYFVRQLFIPASGLLFSADAAQIEFRLFAHYSGSERLLKAYADDPNVSFHRVAEGILKPFRSDMPYTKIKSMNFLFVYGGGKAHAAEYLELPRDIADQFCDIYHQAFPEVKTLGKKAEALAKSRGFVKSILGRRARFPDPKFAYKALNAVIQPTAADIFKQKMVEVYRERHRLGFTLRMVVHDELVGDIADEESGRKILELLNRQSFSQVKVPILWAGKSGNTWAACK